jgi:hypothetical protein
MASGSSISTGKGKKTFKAQSQSGIMPTDNALNWPITIDGKLVPYKPFEDLIDNPDFDLHKQTAVDHGFELFLKRARIGQSKHVRVRPKFNTWKVQGNLTVTDEAITDAVLDQILQIGGRYKGLCDWRPGCATPGPFGTFNATIEEMIVARPGRRVRR